MAGEVYFVHAPTVNMIKIGRSHHAKRRFWELRLISPVPLEVMGVIPGGYEKETELHRQFAHIRSHGEWFHGTKDLISFIRLTLLQAARERLLQPARCGAGCNSRSRAAHGLRYGPEARRMPVRMRRPAPGRLWLLRRPCRARLLLQSSSHHRLCGRLEASGMIDFLSAPIGLPEAAASCIAIGIFVGMRLERFIAARRAGKRRDISFLTKPHVDHDPSEYAANWEGKR